MLSLQVDCLGLISSTPYGFPSPTSSDLWVQGEEYVLRTTGCGPNTANKKEIKPPKTVKQK